MKNNKLEIKAHWSYFGDVNFLILLKSEIENINTNLDKELKSLSPIQQYSKFDIEIFIPSENLASLYKQTFIRGKYWYDLIITYVKEIGLTGGWDLEFYPKSLRDNAPEYSWLVRPALGQEDPAVFNLYAKNFKQHLDNLALNYNK